MKFLITGANGLLGTKLVDILRSNEEQYVATSRGPCRLSDCSNYQSMDVTDEEEVQDVLSREQPDIIIHTAAMTQVDDCETEKDKCLDLNVRAVENMVKYSEEIGCFFLHLSTDFIFDGSHGPLDEDEDPSPVNFYGESKLASEKLVMDSKLSWAIARTILVYGITPNMARSNIILWVRSKLMEGETIRVVNDQFRTPTLAEDLAMGCYLIAKNRAEGVYNIGGKDLLTPYQMANEVADYFGLDKGLIVETDSNEFKQPARRPLRTGLSIDKARKELGYSPRSFREGINVIADQI